MREGCLIRNEGSRSIETQMLMLLELLLLLLQLLLLLLFLPFMVLPQTGVQEVGKQEQQLWKHLPTVVQTRYNRFYLTRHREWRFGDTI